jgi:DNA processing protein
MSREDAWLRLALVPGLGPLTVDKLLAATGGEPEEVFDLGMDRLQAVDGIGGERARRLCDPRGAARVEEERAACHGAGVRIVTRDGADYPKVLRELHDPPLALWMTGAIEARDRLSIAVVGPRRPSPYGHRQGHRLSLALARLGTCVVSGLARGIDTVAHEAALEAKGRTIAVLGSGFKQLYPDENRPLAQRIADGHGAVISEYPYGVPPMPGNFPRRNRIIAALGLATLVIEAGARSGALVTARLAGELGRQALVLPGPIDNPECAGSNHLIRDGATLVTSVDEILEEVSPLLTLSRGSDPQPPENPRAAALSGRERQVFLLLGDQPRSVDELVRLGDLPASVASATLLSLELRRLAKRTPAGYVRAG